MRLSGGQLAGGNSTSEKAENDFYATDPKTVDLFMERALNDGLFQDMQNQKIWECACGTGCLSERLKYFGHDVFSTDLVDRSYGEVKDFLESDNLPEECTCILTNPPYKYALEFIKHSLDLLPVNGMCVMFLKTTFLEGQKRHDELFCKNPPKYVLQFSKRVLCAKNGEFQRMRDGGGSAVSYAWFVWQKGYKGDTIIKWI